MSNASKDFKKFIIQGDLVAVAVAFILGLAFKSVVDSLVNDIIMPIVGMVVGKRSFSSLTVTINDAVIRYGSFIGWIVNFVIIGATLFVIVRLYEHMRSLRSAAEKAEDPSELDVLTEIRDLLRDQRRPV